jgi:general secretion pathway protein C
MGTNFNRKISHYLRRHAKRFPGFASLALFMLLCASGAYWVMQLARPPLHTVATAPQPDVPQPDISRAAGLFGGNGTAGLAVSNYRLLGVVVAQNPAESVAVLSADGKPAQSLRIGKEIVPGTSIKEVHKTYVIVSEGGILKRLILPEHTQNKPGMAPAGGAPAMRPVNQGNVGG